MPGLLGEIEAAAVTWEETCSNPAACPPRIVQKARWMHQHLLLLRTTQIADHAQMLRTTFEREPASWHMFHDTYT